MGAKDRNSVTGNSMSCWRQASSGKAMVLVMSYFR